MTINKPTAVMNLSNLVGGDVRFAVPAARVFSRFIDFLHWCEQAALFNTNCVSHKGRTILWSQHTRAVRIMVFQNKVYYTSTNSEQVLE
jgi:hypothetical protein